MFTDITVSVDLNTKFNDFLKERNNEIGEFILILTNKRLFYLNLIFFFFIGINLSIKVLQAGAWPLGPTQVVIPFAVPQEFEKSIRMVKQTFFLNLIKR